MSTVKGRFGAMFEHYFLFDGKRSRDYGVWISGGGTYNAPERDAELVSVPGRNGDLYFDNGKYNNIRVTYPAFISRGFSRRVAGFRGYMASKIGYKRLEDTYHPDEYRLAVFEGGLEVETAPRNLAGAFEVTFNCKPQRFLRSGDESQTFTANGTIYNPTLFNAKPLIRAYGTGTFTINGVSVQIKAASSYTDIDCDLMDAFKGSTNCNNNIVLTNGEFPQIAPGTNAITKSGITSLVITPRWWTL
jgi:phage-related protein